MSAISDSIEKFILTLLEEDDAIELQRNELAHYFSCAPSQINYVLATRFNLGRGYAIESRRGGGGYIRITRVRVDRQTLLMHVINSIGDTLDLPSARAIIQNLTESEAIDRAAGKALLSAVSDSALHTVPKEHRGPLRANICKQVLIHLV